jgi:predicted pyridoxine 5'-phosphate oxidase superfamily flavin-nucleotide-binding protein
MNTPFTITSLDQLAELYEPPSERVRLKQIDPRISIDPALLARLAVDGKTPKSVLVITVQEVFIQCARALLRSDLWNPTLHVRRGDLPSIGTVLAAHTGGKVDAAVYDAEAKVRTPDTLY